MATPLHKTPSPGVIKIYKFGKTFNDHHDYTLSLSKLFIRLEKTFKEIMHFHYITFMATPWNKNP